MDAPFIECTDENYHASLRQKLDLHHLFSRKIDNFLKSCGIAEKMNNLIQVSIPGEIVHQDGKREVGFFQYSFTEDTWTCIHRCFRNYDASKEDIFISPVLRKILEDFLQEHVNQINL